MYSFVRKTTGEFNLPGKEGLKAAAVLREISTKKRKLDTLQSLGQQKKCSGGKTKHQSLHLCANANLFVWREPIPVVLNTWVTSPWGGVVTDQILALWFITAKLHL